MADPRPTNRLASETSAYLRQHMHNPVDWRPWGDEALAEAEREGKPLLVSIGYSACHWCHVMERESFEDPTIGALMNEHYVPIKVDREERPDVDQIYMDTIVRLQGHGGWPLTVFCKPGGEPFYAGTYFPPEPRHGLPSFRDVLTGLARAWHEERDKIDETARQILAALAQRPQGIASAPPGGALAGVAARQLLQSADEARGGFGDGPKFPTPTNLELLLAAEPFLEAHEVEAGRAFLELTCAEMARRGLYDQLGGGFHRYCVDGHWGVPHFEKMLYDQGQLMRVYADLWRRSGANDDDLVWPVQETAAWLAREMRAEDGGWFASQDADSEGEEGKFYVWTPAEVEAVLGAERAGPFCDTYSVSPGGNFEGKNVLWDRPRGPRAAFRDERRELLVARSERVWPETDHKRVTAWNGLTVSGLAYAGSVFEDDTLLAAAREGADFVLRELRDEDGRLLRIHAEGQSKVPAFLDDTAAMLSACLDLYRAGAGDDYLTEAIAFAEEVVARFFDGDEGDLFLAPADGERLPHRPRSDHDGATPNSTGLATLGLLRAAALTGREDLRRPAELVLRGHAFVLEKAPTGFPTLLRAAILAEQPPSTAVVVGDPESAPTQALATAARRLLGPEEAVVVVAPGTAPAGLDPSLLEGREATDGRATAYLCRGVVCSLPVHEPEALAALERP